MPEAHLGLQRISALIKLSQPPSPIPQCIVLRLNSSGQPLSPKTFVYIPHPFGLLRDMPSKTPMASVEQNSPSKVPILTAGNISPAIMCQFEHVCKNYFIHKKIIADDQVSLIIGGILDDRVTDWIIAEHERLIALSFNVFMMDFHQNYLAEDWEEDTLRKLLSMSQGTNSFWDYAVAVQSKNALLRGMTSHLPDDKLHHQIGAGMEVCLSKKVSSEKLNKILDFHIWLNEFKQCDNVLHTEREEYECIAKENRDTSHRSNYASKPSFRRAPSNNNNFLSDCSLRLHYKYSRHSQAMP
jgi:hypothetical protein